MGDRYKTQHEGDGHMRQQRLPNTFQVHATLISFLSTYAQHMHGTYKRYRVGRLSHSDHMRDTRRQRNDACLALTTCTRCRSKHSAPVRLSSTKITVDRVKGSESYLCPMLNPDLIDVDREMGLALRTNPLYL